MIILDTSAVLAILLPEHDANVYEKQLAPHAGRAISAASLLETGMVLVSRRGKEKALALPTWLDAFRIAVHSVTQEQAMAAVIAFDRFGKGRHPAGLNFGDCFAYALAKAHDAPLLFKGDDFRKTDITSALP